MRALPFYRASAALAVALLMSTLAARAQDFEQVAPKEPEAPAAAQLSLPAEQREASSASTRPILAELKGLRFVAAPAEIVKSGLRQEGVSVAGAGLALLDDPAFRQRLSNRFLGKPLSMADLQSLATMVRERYRQHSLPLVDVSFPEQDITTGAVQAVVTVYRVGQIRIHDNGRFSKSLIRSEVQLKPGDLLDLDTLRADLNRLARNPFHPADVRLAKGQATGQTDIDIDLRARFPFRAYLAYDNDGEAITGRERYSAGVNLANLFGLDEQLSYQFMTSPDLWRSRDRGPGLSNDPRFTAHSLSFLAPLAWGDFVNVFAAYAQMVPDLGSNFGQTGHDLQIGVRYIHDLRPIGKISHQLTIGFDFKRSDNDLAYGGIMISGHTANVEQAVFSYGATRPDAWGQTALQDTLAVSPGGLSDGNSDAAFAAYGTVGAHARYVYDRLDISRVNALPYGFSGYAHLQAQIASTELLPSEQIGLGGVDSVRGYDPRKVNGSNGAVANLELRSPSFPLLSRAMHSTSDALQLLAFFDVGWVGYQHAQAYQPRSATLESAGIGARYALSRFIDLRFDYGWQLKAAPGETSADNLATVSVTLAN